jgi:hypothetical protein
VGSAQVKTEGEADGRGRAASVLVLVVVLLAPTLLVLQWSRPAPVRPRLPPPLLLDPAAVRAQRAEDAALAARAEDTARRRQLYDDVNRAEVEQRDTRAMARHRRERLADVLTSIAADAEARAALRAADLARLEPALRGTLEPAERAEAIGAFAQSLVRYRLVEDGRQSGPTFVVRTLFKARWNGLHGRPRLEGLSPIELQAYHGWLALGAEGAPSESRLAALDAYAEAGGTRVAETRAILRCREGLDAREAYDAALSEGFSFRLRNHALACALPLDDAAR